jgi:hypothetical protein
MGYTKIIIFVGEFLKVSIADKDREGIGLSYRPARARTFKCLWGPGIDSKE